MNETHVDVDRKERHVELFLNRPDAHNALGPQLINEMTKLFSGFNKDKSLRAVVIRGRGASFCAGGDLRWMKETLNGDLEQSKKDSKQLADMYEAIYSCKVPVLAVIHGNVMGGGLGLTAVCDLVAAETRTQFAFSEVRLGLVPAIICPYLMQKVPTGKLLPLLQTGESFSVDRAKEMGLVHHFGTMKQAEDYVEKQLQRILENGPEAVRMTKALVQDLRKGSWESTRKKTIELNAKRRRAKEGQEGMRAFFEKRSPEWRTP